MDCLAIRWVLVLVLNRMLWSHSGLVGLLFVLIDVVTAFCSFSHTQILNSYTYFKDVYYVDNTQMFIKHVWLQALTRIHFLSDAFRKPEFFFVTAVVWTRIMLASYFNFCWAYNVTKWIAEATKFTNDLRTFWNLLFFFSTIRQLVLCEQLSVMTNTEWRGPRNNICYSGHVKYFSDWLIDARHLNMF